MKVKIFSEFGSGVSRLEQPINEWLADKSITVVKTELVAASAGESEDRAAAVVLFVWYEG